jgi:hypothetical protein
MFSITAIGGKSSQSILDLQELGKYIMYPARYPGDFTRIHESEYKSRITCRWSSPRPNVGNLHFFLRSFSHLCPIIEPGNAFTSRPLSSVLCGFRLLIFYKLYHCGLTPAKRSTLCDALEKRDYRIFENVFQSLVSKAQLIAGKSGRRFKNPLKIIDASTRELCYVFITNNMELSAQDIADIYKSRRQVELFFKWIKQNLKIKTFWGTGKNAVFTQIWIALIVSILLWLHKAIDGIPASTQRMIQMLKTTILSRKTILELFQATVPPEKQRSYQLYFQGIKC